MYALTTLSAFLNIFIIVEIVFLWLFMHDEQIMLLMEDQEHGRQFYQWYHLCEILLDSRCFFWFMLSFILAFLSVSVIISKLIIQAFYAYERRQGRIYRNSPQLRFYRQNEIKTQSLRPEIEKFLEENKACYEVPKEMLEKESEECMICLQEFIRETS